VCSAGKAKDCDLKREKTVSCIVVEKNPKAQNDGGIWWNPFPESASIFQIFLLKEKYPLVDLPPGH
jgi:hypothetical protein